MAQSTIITGPLIPYSYTVVLQVFHVRVAPQKPQQLVYDTFKMELFRGKQRKALAQVKTHLMAEDTFSSRSSTVCLYSAMVNYFLQ